MPQFWSENVTDRFEVSGWPVRSVIFPPMMVACRLVRLSSPRTASLRASSRLFWMLAPSLGETSSGRQGHSTYTEWDWPRCQGVPGDVIFTLFDLVARDFFQPLLTHGTRFHKLQTTSREF